MRGLLNGWTKLVILNYLNISAKERIIYYGTAPKHFILFLILWPANSKNKFANIFIIKSSIIIRFVSCGSFVRRIIKLMYSRLWRFLYLDLWKCQRRS